LKNKIEVKNLAIYMVNILVSVATSDGKMDENELKLIIDTIRNYKSKNTIVNAVLEYYKNNLSNIIKKMKDLMSGDCIENIKELENTTKKSLENLKNILGPKEVKEFLIEFLALAVKIGLSSGRYQTIFSTESSLSPSEKKVLNFYMKNLNVKLSEVIDFLKRKNK